MEPQLAGILLLSYQEHGGEKKEYGSRLPKPASGRWNICQHFPGKRFCSCCYSRQGSTASCKSGFAAGPNQPKGSAVSQSGNCMETNLGVPVTGECCLQPTHTHENTHDDTPMFTQESLIVRSLFFDSRVRTLILLFTPMAVAVPSRGASARKEQKDLCKS